MMSWHLGAMPESAGSRVYPGAEGKHPMHNRFQLLLRLQDFRRRMRRWQRIDRTATGDANTAAEVCAALRNLALVASQEGFGAFSSLCLRLAERAEPWQRQHAVPASALGQLDTWMEAAERCMRQPSNRFLAARLVQQLNAVEWQIALSEREREAFISEMVDQIA